MPKPRPWTKEELILALDLYFKIGSKDREHPQVVQLSDILNRLSDQPTTSDPGLFRNPTGVSTKLRNFARMDSATPGMGLTRGSRLEQIIWEEFKDKRDEIADLALQLAQSISGPIASQKGPTELTECEHLYEETIQLGFDPRNGLVTSVSEIANSIVVTPLGASISLHADGGRTKATIPLHSISGVEIREPIRSRRRFYQGTALLLGGLMLGFTVWILFELFLFVLITGGIPVVASIYILTGFAFPDSREELILHSLGGTFHLQLETDRAILDSHEFSRQLSAVIQRHSNDHGFTG